MLLCSLSLTISSMLDYVCGMGLENHSFHSKLIDADKRVLQSIGHVSAGDGLLETEEAAVHRFST